MEKFDANKKYHFNKDKYQKTLAKSNLAYMRGHWAIKHDGEEVVINPYNHCVGTVGENYRVYPIWCDEVAQEPRRIHRAVHQATEGSTVTIANSRGEIEMYLAMSAGSTVYFDLTDGDVEMMMQEHEIYKRALEYIASGSWTKSSDLQGATWQELEAVFVAKRALQRRW